MPTTAPTKAPAKSCASIEMLTTPTRSDITPDSPPKIIGMASTIAFPSRKASGTVPPAPSHPRSPNNATAPKSTIHHSGTCLFWLTHQAATAVIATRIMPATRFTPLEVATKAGMTNRAVSAEILYVTSASRPKTPNTTRISRLKPAITIVERQLTFSSARENMPGVTSVLTAVTRSHPRALCATRGHADGRGQGWL